MDLILWRHAEAVLEREGLPDLDRALTTKGERQAKRMAEWLEARLPADTRTYPEQSADIEADLEQARVHEFEMRLWDQEIRTRHKIKVRLGRA